MSDTPEDLNHSASIVFQISKDGEFSIDVNIEDFDEDSIESLATLFSSIGNDSFQAQALLIIKDAFLDLGKELEFTTFLTSTILKTRLSMDKEETQEREIKDDDPIIKPTDLL